MKILEPHTPQQEILDTKFELDKGKWVLKKGYNVVPWFESGVPLDDGWFFSARLQQLIKTRMGLITDSEASKELGN